MWYLYILRCKDGSLYTGITTDVEKRLEAHRTGKGAKYTKGRAPLKLRYLEDCEDHSYIYHLHRWVGKPEPGL